MRALPLLASLLLAGTSGCIVHSERIYASGVGSIAAFNTHGDAPSRPTGYVDAPGAFDAAAASASLESIEYLDCGPGSIAELTVTFAPDGHVDAVTIDTGALADDVAACVVERFSHAEAPAFVGAPRALRCRIRLAQ